MQLLNFKYLLPPPPLSFSLSRNLKKKNKSYDIFSYKRSNNVKRFLFNCTYLGIYLARWSILAEKLFIKENRGDWDRRTVSRETLEYDGSLFPGEKNIKWKGCEDYFFFAILSIIQYLRSRKSVEKVARGWKKSLSSGRCIVIIFSILFYISFPPPILPSGNRSRRPPHRVDAIEEQ